MNTYGLIGKNISYSFSEQYFTQKFTQEQILDTVYKTFDLQTITEITTLLEDKNIKGLNVTIPYKEAILPYLHDLNPEAKAIGAVNVVKLVNNQLIGYNSDIYGFEISFLELLQPHHKKALILGTGGAAKAIQYVLRKHHIEYKMVSRTETPETISYENLTQDILTEYNIIINCSPVGTFPAIEEKPKLNYDYIGAEHYLYDLVYNPLQTAFLKEGANRGATTQNGLKMLELQAEKAWEIWNL